MRVVAACTRPPTGRWSWRWSFLPRLTACCATPRRTVGHTLKSTVALAVIVSMLLSMTDVSHARPVVRPNTPVQPPTIAGRLLVAKDELRDPRFARSVIYMLHHDSTGAMGLIINRPIGEASLTELLNRAGMESKGVTGEIRIHFGGPVEPGQGFVLHTTDFKIEGTKVVQDGFAVTVRPEILHAIGTRTAPRKSLFALGYAGWASGQLEAEIKAGAWEIVAADEALVFDEPFETKWERAMARRTIRL